VTGPVRRAWRLAPAAASAWAAAALTTSSPAWAQPIALGAWAAVAVAVVVCAVPLGRRAAGVRTVVTVALVFAAAAASTASFAAPEREAAASAAPGRALEVVALVTGKVERTAVGYRADAVLQRIEAGERDLPAGVPVTILLEDATGIDLGARIRADATAFRADPGERSVLVVRISDAPGTIEPASGVLGTAAWLRSSLAAAASTLPGPGADLIPGLAVGDTAQVDDRLDERMKTASLSHLTAVSGANCAIVVGLAFLLAAACGASRALRVVVGGAALVGFVILVTPEPSVVRAATMAAIAMLALLLGRRSAGLAVLSLAVAVLLALDPWLASSLGFALSVAATGALLVLAAPLAAGMSRYLPRPLAAVIAVPLAAQIACGPLIVLIDPGVAAYGVVANILAAPAAPVATVVGLAACLAAPVPVLQAGLAALAWLPAAWVAATAELVSTLPVRTVPWAEGPVGLVLLAVVGAAVAVLLVPGAARGPARLIRLLSAGVVTIAAGVALGALAVTAVVVPLSTPDDWGVAMCDVGQGDAVLVRSGDATMLVDTGPEPEPLAGCLDRLGVERVDVLVLTHFDLDHVGGLEAVTGRVGLVLHGPAADAGDERDIRRISADRVVSATAGMRGGLGEATWRVLWPAGGAAFPAGNDASVVVELSGPGLPRTLLLGDLGAGAQRALLASGALQPPYQVVKLAHHGSADQEPALYAALGASLVLIPVGADNDYRHPRDEALGMAGRRGAAIARSDRDGLVLAGLTATDRGARVTVWRERAPVEVGGAE